MSKPTRPNYKLADAIRESDLSIGEIAKRCGTSRTCIHDYTNGRTRPRVDRALTIAKLLGKSVEELWGLED